MSRHSKGPRPMTVAERKAASRAKAKASAVVEPSGAIAAPVVPLVVAAKSKRPTGVQRPAAPPPAPAPPKLSKPTPPPPIGETLAEHEQLTATLKVRAGRADASGQDIANYQRALERLTELRGGHVPELTESSMARSPIFHRWVKRLLDAVEKVPGALEAIKAELSR